MVHPLNQTRFPEAAQLQRQYRFMDQIDQRQLIEDLNALALAAQPAFARLRGLGRIRKQFDRSVPRHRGILLLLKIRQRGSYWAKNSELVSKVLAGKARLSADKRDLMLRRIQNRVNREVSAFNLKVTTPGLPKRTKRFAQSLGQRDRFELLAPHVGEQLTASIDRDTPLYKAYRLWAAGQLIDSCVVLGKLADEIRNSYPTDKDCWAAFSDFGGTPEQWDLIRRYAGKLKKKPDAALLVAAVYAASDRISPQGQVRFDLHRTRWIISVWNASRRAGLQDRGPFESVRH